MTDVYKILNDGTVNKHTFALSAKQVLIACIMQEWFHNYNTGEYPCDINALCLTKEVMLFVLCMTVVIIAFGANKRMRCCK